MRKVSNLNSSISHNDRIITVIQSRNHEVRCLLKEEGCDHHHMYEILLVVRQRLCRSFVPEIRLASRVFLWQ